MNGHYHFYLAMNGIRIPYDYLNNFHETLIKQKQAQVHNTNYKLKYISFELLNGVNMKTIN
ncbi:MAG: hypothetical protein KAS53_11245 [Candidatus Cloacimonetes bacterium]|nr:hypothetical protein [Candidatus Cloacimonadota bacterium]